MSDTIDISGLDKAAVLAALFNASKQQGLGLADPSGDAEMTVEDARAYTESGEQQYDYLRGRVLKVDLSQDVIRTGLYDRDNGIGAAAKALAPLLEAAQRRPAGGDTVDPFRVGRVFAAKKPKRVGFSGFWDDRQILWAGRDQIQYDSPALGLGRRYPMVTRQAFEAWAGQDVTDQVPEDSWRV